MTTTNFAIIGLSFWQNNSICHIPLQFQYRVRIVMEFQLVNRDIYVSVQMQLMYPQICLQRALVFLERPFINYVGKQGGRGVNQLSHISVKITTYTYLLIFKMSINNLSWFLDRKKTLLKKQVRHQGITCSKLSLPYFPPRIEL